MYNIITYSDMNSEIDEKIRKKKVIPYAIFPGDKFKKGKWYYNRFYDNFFKILEVEYVNDKLEYAYIITDDNMYSMITTDLCHDDLLLEKDKKGIYKSYIFNSNIPYTGAEIKYWFFMHNINCFDQKYYKFWRYVDRYSKDCLDDRKRYRCYADTDIDGSLINCRIKEYNVDLIANRERSLNDYKEKDIKFIKHDMKRNKKKMKNNKKLPRD